jgi:hypothetical protein
MATWKEYAEWRVLKAINTREDVSEMFGQIIKLAAPEAIVRTAQFSIQLIELLVAKGQVTMADSLDDLKWSIEEALLLGDMNEAAERSIAAMKPLFLLQRALPAGSSISITRTAVEPVPPPAPIINVKAVVEMPQTIELAINEPLDMRLVAMPDRMTSSRVERNVSGDIVKTTQIESDLQGAAA